ncbi:MAG: hypothetical protein ACI35Q_02685 [Marinilabiliaceae bacterium]
MMTPEKQTSGQDLRTRISNLFKSLLPSEEQRKAISDEFHNGVSDIKKTATEGWAKMTADLAQLDKDIEAANAANVVCEECDSLTSQKLFAEAKSIAVAGANGIAAYFERHDAVEGKVGGTVYLANVNDRELLPVATNKFAILRAKEISSDVLGLFFDSKLVILN